MLKIKVKPGSSEQKIEKLGEEHVIKLKSEPRDNKANIELIKLIAKHFGVSTANVKLKKGFSSRKKIIEVVE